MKKVFISYRHVEPDESLAQILAQNLTKKGYDVFIDTRIRPAGDGVTSSTTTWPRPTHWSR